MIRLKRIITSCLLMLCLTLSGCGDRLLQRSYSSVTPHSEAYRVAEDEDTLRAENYQELVNALLILVGEHNEDGVVRVYGEYPNISALAGAACVEVQQEIALGAYLCDYITYSGAAENGYYKLSVHFSYRRTAEEQAALINATSTEALPDLLRIALEEGRETVAIRVGYFATDRAGVMALVSSVRDEAYPPEEELPDDETPAEAAEGEAAAEPPVEGELPESTEMPPESEDVPPEPKEPVYDVSPWEVLFYPDNARPEIVEVILNKAPDA